ncbi:MAG: DNA polymerase I, partial [Deltaproteobacteria bacterium]
EEISLSRDLARVRRDLDLPVDLKDLSPAEKDAAGLREMFRKLGFTVPLFGILPRERGGEEGGAQEVKVRPVTAARDLESFLDEAGERVGIFCREDRLVVSSEQGAVSVPGELSSSLGPLLKGRGKSVVFYDAKEAARRNPSLKPLLKGSFEDVMVMAYIASPEESSFALDRLVTKYLGSSVDPGGEAAGAFLVPLFRELKETLSREGLENLYREVDLPLVPVLLTMEERGIILRREALERLSREIEGELGNIEREIREIAGEEVNLASPKQVSFLLFEKLGLPPVKRTKTGYSTDISVLEELSPLHEVPRLIIRHRMLAKLKSTYVDVLPGLVDPRTGRIHTSFHQTTTATGRLSSSNPNLQNIPIRTEEGRKIRDAFVAEEGYFFLGADYSQIELRVLAHLSGDETLKEIFHEGRDVHTETAVALFGVGKGEVTPEMRRQAKVVNFGIIYGMSPYGLSRELKIGQKEAREYIESYFSRYPGVREFIDETIEKAKETGYVETLFGRKRRLPDLSSRNQNLRQAAERMAINTPVQGTAADIIKLSMIRLHHRLLERGLDAHLVLQIHDELVLEVREESLEEAKEILRDSMENVVELSVPLTVDLKWGRTWGEI